MRLTKDGQVITLDNENHISAFLASGWAEEKSPAPSTPLVVEAEAEPEEKAVEVKVEAKKPVGRKRQEKR